MAFGWAEGRGFIGRSGHLEGQVHHRHSRVQGLGFTWGWEHLVDVDDELHHNSGGSLLGSSMLGRVGLDVSPAKKFLGKGGAEVRYLLSCMGLGFRV